MKGNAIPAENFPCTTVHRPSRNCLRFVIDATGCDKKQKIATKIVQNTRFEIPPFALPPIGHCGEKFNIGAQLHLFRYKRHQKFA